MICLSSAGYPSRDKVDRNDDDDDDDDDVVVVRQSETRLARSSITDWERRECYQASVFKATPRSKIERHDTAQYCDKYKFTDSCPGVPAPTELAQCAFDKTTLKPARLAVYAVRCGLLRPTSRVIHYHESYNSLKKFVKNFFLGYNDGTFRFELTLERNKGTISDTTTALAALPPSVRTLGRGLINLRRDRTSR